MATDPVGSAFAPFARLRERIDEILTERGLQLVSFWVVPGDDHDRRNQLQLLAVLADTTPAPPDDGFEEVLRSAKSAELEQKSAEVLKDLKHRLSRGDGFL